MKRLLYLLIFLIQSFIVNGQRGYYVKDSLVSVGVKLIDGGAIKNAQQCQVEGKKETLTYSPDEVKEYGFVDGSVYISRIIKIDNEEKKVFLERLVEGKINLYYYKDKKGKKFFFEKDNGQLVEVLKKGIDNSNYKNFIKPYTQDCNNVTEALKLVSYTKPSLSKYIDQYNSCLHKPFPFVRYGLIIGYGISKPQNLKISDKILKNAVFKNDNTFNIGVFGDIPIFFSYFSLHPEMYFQKNGFSSHSIIGNTVNDIIINTTSINIPLLIRYTFPTLKLRPYVNVGGAFTYNLRNNNAVYPATISNNIIEIEETNKRNIYSEKQIGYAVGGGIQYNIDYRKSLFFELRYNNLYGLTDETYGNKSFQFIIGINF
jgi:hypothetical protein